jgi:hypothetical protein
VDALLPQDRKEDPLSSRGSAGGPACFANPRNHPGPPRRTPIVAQDFREPLALSREAMARVVVLCRHLAPERDRAFVFARYLETVLPDDASRSRLVSETMTQLTPEESLFFLRNSMTNLHEVAIGISRLARVPFRFFYAVLGVAKREVAQSPFFNPLTALEFRPEFDRIQNPRILELMRTVPGDASRRLVALAFLSLFRMLRYLVVLESCVHSLHEGGRRNAGVIYVVMSVLRSDARALTSYLRHRAGPMLAEGYERDLLRTPAKDISGRYDGLLSQGHQLLELKATLETIGANVRLEMRRAFEHDFPPPDPAPGIDALRSSVAALVRNLRPALQNAILFLGKSLGARLEEQGVFDDDTARRLLSERLRRDVWMFARIVRAFADKAKATPAGEVRWQGVPPLQFVREFSPTRHGLPAAPHRGLPALRRVHERCGRSRRAICSTRFASSARDRGVRAVLCIPHGALRSHRPEGRARRHGVRPEGRSPPVEALFGRLLNSKRTPHS